MSIIYSWMDLWCPKEALQSIIRVNTLFVPAFSLRHWEQIKTEKNCSVPNSGWFLCWLILCYSYIYTVIQFKIFLTHNFKNNVYGTQATSSFQDSLMLKRVSFICPVFVEEILSTRKENQLIRNWSDPLINSLNLTLDRCDLRKLIRGQLHQFNYKE